jgi:hypothetical protein
LRIISHRLAFPAAAEHLSLDTGRQTRYCVGGFSGGCGRADEVTIFDISYDQNARPLLEHLPACRCARVRYFDQILIVPDFDGGAHQS